MRAIRARWLSGVVAVAAASLAACGGPPARGFGPESSDGHARSADAPNIARQSAEPRTNDPTAAGPAPMRPTPGASATVGGAATPPRGPEDPAAWKAPAKPKEAPKRIGARHVLVMWMGSERAPASIVRSRTQALAVAEEVHERAKAGEDFARLAVEFSDEPGAGGRGGSLGTFGRGQMVPAFEAAAFALEVGQVSDIVETPFGFHVILRTE